MGKKEVSKDSILISSLVSTMSKEQLESLLIETTKQLQEKYNYKKQQITELTQKPINIPVEIFSQSLSPLEAIVKFLKENKNMHHADIASTLKRTQKTIWTIYSRVKTKKKFQIKNKLSIPLTSFRDRKYSIMEIVVKNLLLEHNIKSIAVILNKPVQTIYTIKRRVDNK